MESHNFLRRDLLEIHSTDDSFKGILDKYRKSSVRCIKYSFAYAKDKWDKSHATPDFQVGDLVLISTTNFKAKGLKNLKDSFAGPFVMKDLHAENAFEVELSEELSNTHPEFPVSLIKSGKSGDAEELSLRNKVPQHITPGESSSTKKITNLLKERKLRTTKVKEYFVRYSDPASEDVWLGEKDIPEATKILRRFRNTRNNNITK
ncbi:hypothetical protein O181_063013 [Austropuccinia psidii MF-1]|uniref:Chromo domain-containing protein n=1 Tax=Austropuccinia psidii MF-1 TaxID=1389203 RepID=A0A9Q3I059_9BASI|nr:hypothetical protein [Austropuccinia psidii MF-1]